MSWTAAATIGSSILGGIFGNKQQKKSEQFERQRIRMIAEDAKAAGIHPLAALGGNAGWQNPYNGSSPMGSAIADGAGKFAQIKAQEQLQAAQVDALRSEAERNRADAQLAISEARSRTLIKQAADDKLGAATIGSENTGKALEGSGIIVSNLAPAEAWEQEYGEVGGAFGGTAKLIHDIGQTLKINWEEAKKLNRETRKDWTPEQWRNYLKENL